MREWAVFSTGVNSDPQNGQSFVSSENVCSHSQYPMSLELEAARKKSAAPMPEHQAETISTTEEARNARRAAEQQAQATAEKEAAEEKAAEMESSMLEMIDLTDNEVKEVLTKINIMLSRYCKGTSFRVIAEEIPRLTPHVFNAQAIARRYGLNYSTDAA